MTKKNRPTPKKWSLYKRGELIQESDDWDELFNAAKYWMQKQAPVWLIRNGTLPK